MTAITEEVINNKKDYYPLYYNKRDYRLKGLENRLAKSTKTGIYLKFTTSGDIITRDGYLAKNESNIGSAPHYIVDLKHNACIRTLIEDCRANMNSSYPNHVYVEIHNLKSRTTLWKKLVGFVIMDLKNKFGFSDSNIIFDARDVGGVDEPGIKAYATDAYLKNNVKFIVSKNIAGRAVSNLLEKIYFTNNEDICYEKNDLTEGFVDDNPYEVIESVGEFDSRKGFHETYGYRLFGCEGYYINNIPNAAISSFKTFEECTLEQRKRWASVTTLYYLKKFIEPKIDINKDLYYKGPINNKINYVAYFSDENKPLAVAIATIYGGARVIKDNGRSGVDIAKEKDSGHLIYIGALGNTPLSTAVEAIRRFVING